MRRAIVAAGFLLAGCGDDTGAGGGTPGAEVACGQETCAECCNADVCAAGDACDEGANEFDRLILFCDGPSDCAEGERCCADSGGSGATIAKCLSEEECRDLRSPTLYCNSGSDCASGSCSPEFGAEYVSVCDGSVCEPGATVFCRCPDGLDGTKTCYEEEFLPCRGPDGSVCE